MPVNINIRQLTEAGRQLVKEIETHLESYVTNKCTGIINTEEWLDIKSEFRDVAHTWVWSTPQESGFWHYKEE